MNAKKIAALLLAVVMVLGLAACGSKANAPAAAPAEKPAEAAPAADEKTFNIDLATAYAADAPAGVALAKFVEDVATASNGTINISLFTDGTLGSAGDNYASVASGDLDMCMAGLEALDLYAP